MKISIQVEFEVSEGFRTAINYIANNISEQSKGSGVIIPKQSKADISKPPKAEVPEQPKAEVPEQPKVNKKMTPAKRSRLKRMRREEIIKNATQAIRHGRKNNFTSKEIAKYLNMKEIPKLSSNTPWNDKNIYSFRMSHMKNE